MIFDDTATGGTNAINFSDTINSLTYEQTSGFHTTLIPDGVTLTIHGSAANYGLIAGQGQAGTLILATNIIAGGGSINLDNAGALLVDQGANQDDNHNMVLDMSGLDALVMNGSSQGFIAVGGGGYGGTDRTRAAGTLYLAKTNQIYMKYNFRIGDNDTANSPNLCAVYLGQTNSIVLGNNNDDFSTGFSGNTNLLAFTPGLVNPVLYVRSEYSATVPRVPTWIIANAGRLPSVGTNDFTGGTVDVMANDVRMGRAASGANPALGVLTFDGGTFDANTIEDGWQTVSAGGTGVGIINVNTNAASGTFGMLVVNNSLVLGDVIGTLTAGSAGTLNINGGLVLASQIIAGGGEAAVTMNHGTLVATNGVGSPAAPIATFNAVNATLRVRLNGSAIVTNIVTTDLNASGVNTITIDSMANVNGLTTFPIISYTGTAPVAGSFVKGDLPPGFAANLVNNTAQKRIDLVIAPKATVTPHISSVSLFGTNLTVGGTNGFPSGHYYVLGSTNLGRPLDQWLPLSTNPFDIHGEF
ncbi:MAG TPA: hypothetical protein VFF11_01925, partial [Candidatus Binatia bacterium]|nr:hypothetical protein [Candidatus Binatia bacterium]